MTCLVKILKCVCVCVCNEQVKHTVDLMLNVSSNLLYSILLAIKNTDYRNTKINCSHHIFPAFYVSHKVALLGSFIHLC